MSIPPRIALPATLAASAAVLAITGCISSGPEPVSPSSVNATSAPHWSYEGAQGPDEWGHLSADYASCDAGAAQSPIDLPSVPPALTGQIDIETESSNAEAVDTGHTIQLTDADDASTVTYDGASYELSQMHFHTPSEHTIAGQPSAVEFHFVHADDDDELLVVSVLGVEGQASTTWAPFIDAIAARPEAASETAFADLEVDVADMLPSSLDHYAYQGSLTTPPCSEGVQWIVLSAQVQFSPAQLETLSGAHEHNTRPVRALGDRAITGGTGSIQD